MCVRVKMDKCAWNVSHTYSYDLYFFVAVNIRCLCFVWCARSASIALPPTLFVNILQKKKIVFIILKLSTLYFSQITVNHFDHHSLLIIAAL